MALNLAKVVIGYLKDRPEEKFSARQIAEWVFATYPDECQEKRANSRGDYIKSDADLVQQLVAEISSQRPRMQTKHPELKTTEGRPRKYYYSERSDSAEVAAAESESTSTAADASALKIDEHALYPLLSQYLWEEFGVSPSALTRSVRRTSAGRTATAGFTRTWWVWRTWARSGTAKCATA